ncbi:MAG: alpha-ketoglutarate-dependent dioxygenase AlkB [Deltaproteobacteria bacterium]
MLADAVVPDKTCVCTGIRWCAVCRDPALRRATGMFPPRELPACEVHDFDLESQRVPTAPDFTGVCVLRDAVDEASAAALLARIEQTPWRPAQSGKRKQHFGPKVSFKHRRLRLAGFEGLPDYIRGIESLARESFAVAAGFETTDAFVLRYEPERQSNLDLHADDTFAYGEVILDLSLESDAALTFVPGTSIDDLERAKRRIRVPLPARSLLVLFGAARYRWLHGILPGDITARRTSITLRTLSDELMETDVGRSVRAVAATSLRTRSPHGGGNASDAGRASGSRPTP